jgi:hypothetical protein
LDFNQLAPSILEIWRKQTRGTQGTIMRAGDDAFLAISGAGFFQILNPASGEVHYTRLGMFQWSSDGCLVTFHGWRVQGFDPVLNEVQEVRLGDAPADNPIVQHAFDQAGVLVIRHADGSQYPIAQIGLARIPDVTLLVNTGFGHYFMDPERRPAEAESIRFVRPGTEGVGHLQSGALEQWWDLEARLPMSAPVRGTILTAWGLCGRAAFVQSCGDINEWSAPALDAGNGPVPSLPVHPSIGELTDQGHLLLPDGTSAGNRFYRLVLPE